MRRLDKPGLTALGLSPDDISRWDSVAGNGAAADIAHEYQSSSVLTNAQVIALPTTAIELIAAPGSGKIIVPTLAWLRCAAAVDYGNIDAGATLFIGYGEFATSSPLVALSEASSSSVSGLLAPGDPVDAQNAFLTTVTRSAGATAPNVGISGIFDSDAANKSISIGSVNAGNYNGGNTANTLTVTVTYRIFDISSGTFI